MVRRTEFDTLGKKIYVEREVTAESILYSANESTDKYRIAIIVFTFFLSNHPLINICLDILILIRYQRLLTKKRILRLIPPKAGCWKAGLLPKLFLELLICSTVSPPGVHYTFKGRIDGGYFEYRYSQK